MDAMLYFAACLVLNLPFGAYRARMAKFSLGWFAAIHAPIPAIVLFRLALGVSPWLIPAGIAAAIAGQALGARVFAPVSWKQTGRAKEATRRGHAAADGVA